MKLETIDVTRLIHDLAESALRERGWVMRPIPYFGRLDRFRARQGELVQVYESYLSHFNEATAHRGLRSCAFADELSREVMRNFYPLLPEDGEGALRTLWMAAVIIDQLLDEDGVEASSLAPVLQWVAGQAMEGRSPDDGRLKNQIPGVNALAAMLEDTLTECRRRAVDASTYTAFHANLARMLDAELDSINIPLDAPPVNRVRTLISDKSVLLSWAGFQACCLGQRLDPEESRDYREICDAVGEVLWIMDDLMDLEEDLERGIWNRSLWQLYDEVGKTRFDHMIASRTGLAEGILALGKIPADIDQITRRLAFLETHPRMKDPLKVRAMLSFWFTTWLGIYR